MKRTIFGSSFVVIFFLSISLFAQLGFRPRTYTLGTVDLMGGGIWNWEQSLPQSWDNLIINGDFSYWPDGNDTIPYGWSSSYAEINCKVTREDSLVKVGNYAMRVTADGAPEGYTDYRLPVNKSFIGRFISLGFWYYASPQNDNTMQVILMDGISNRYVNLKNDGAWHWVQISYVVHSNATVIVVRLYVVPAGGFADYDDFAIFDGMVLMEGRIVTRWSMSWWDYLYKTGIIQNGSRYGFGVAPDTTYNNKFHQGIFLSGTAPVYIMDDTDSLNHAGMFRFGSDGGQFFIDKNESSSGNFSPYKRWFIFNTYGIGMMGAAANDSVQVNIAGSTYIKGRVSSDTLNISSNAPVVPKEGDTYIYFDPGTGNYYLEVYTASAWRRVQIQ